MSTIRISGLLRKLATPAALCLLVLAGVTLHTQTRPEVVLKAAMDKEVLDGDVKGAIEEYKKVVAAAGTNRTLAAQALLKMADAYEKLGDAEARMLYGRVIREFADQREAVAEARARLAASERRPMVRQVWTGYGIGGGDPGSPSADGRYLSVGHLETGDLAVRDLTTGTLHLLTNTGGWDASGDHATSPVISPDGRQIAYEWTIDRESQNELRVAAFAGADPVRPRTVLRQEAADYIRRLAWTADGKQLVAFRSMPDRTSQIAVITIADSSVRAIKSLGWFETDLLSLSPDGRFVAYDAPAGEAGSPRNILVLAVDGSGEVVVARSASNESHPVWSPTGSHLLFLSDRSGTNSLWAVPMRDGRENGAPQLLRADIGALTRLMGITRAGLLYYWTSGTSRNETWMADLDRGRTISAPVPLSDRTLTSNLGPAVSRNGEFVAYYAFRAMTRDTSVKTLVVRSLGSGDERTIPLPDRVLAPLAVGPKWFPDSQSVLVYVNDAQGGGAGFYRLALDTGNTELLLHVPRQAREYDLSPDGRAIFYMMGPQAVRYDIAERRDTELAPGLFHAAQAVSPDGSQLAMALVGGTVVVVPASGGVPREIFKPRERVATTTALRNSLAWAPDSSYLLFADPTGTLTKISLNDGNVEGVGIPNRPVKSPTVYSGGTKIIFNAPVNSGLPTVWSLEEFLPPSDSDLTQR
jgi:Tol biopolymer transport system component